MRRIAAAVMSAWLAGLLPGSAILAQQGGQIDLRIPPPPPPGYIGEALPTPQNFPQYYLVEGPEYIPPMPEFVEIPAGILLSVVLDTPLSTRISKAGNKVTFRLESALPLASDLELPPDTAFVGSVVEVKKPGAFGKGGVLRVFVESIELPTGEKARVTAKVRSQDMDEQGRARADNSRTANLLNIGMWTLQGTMVGAQVRGGKGAAVGAGAGAAIALVLMSMRKGRDVYLEPGMPFTIQMDRRVQLPAKAVYRSQKMYEQQSGLGAGAGPAASTTGQVQGAEAPEDSAPGDRPVLKRRPKK